MKPQVHCHGHTHEQRGVFWKDPETGKFNGGIEYERRRGEGPFDTLGAPPASYPCQVISNNAMCNHQHLEQLGRKYIKGAPRTIMAQRVREAYDPAAAAAAAIAEGEEIQRHGDEAADVLPKPTPRSQWISDWNFTLVPNDLLNFHIEGLIEKEESDRKAKRPGQETHPYSRTANGI